MGYHKDGRVGKVSNSDSSEYEAVTDAEVEVGPPAMNIYETAFRD